MTDPRETTQRHDRRAGTPDVGGPAAKQDDAASEFETAEERAAQGDRPGEDANDLEADNPVEEDTLETVDPDNAPA